MTTQEAAEALGITESLVRRYIREERLKAERHGRDWWVTEAELERFKAIPRPKTGRRKEGQGNQRLHLKRKGE